MNGLERKTPALLTRESMRPKRSSAVRDDPPGGFRLADVARHGQHVRVGSGLDRPGSGDHAIVPVAIGAHQVGADPLGRAGDDDDLLLATHDGTFRRLPRPHRRGRVRLRGDLTPSAALIGESGRQPLHAVATTARREAAGECHRSSRRALTGTSPTPHRNTSARCVDASVQTTATILKASWPLFPVHRFWYGWKM